MLNLIATVWHYIWPFLVLYWLGVAAAVIVLGYDAVLAFFDRLDEYLDNLK